MRPVSVLSLVFFQIAAGNSGLARAADQPALEEVIVTASKREESLQDVSVAVTAISAEALRQSKIVQSEDLTKLVPSLNLQKGMNPRSSSFNIRGIGTQSFSAAVEPSVSTVLDGVVLGRSGMAFSQLYDIERVEVLRGPQGTLFGKNASGGVVHIITRAPGDSLEADIITALEENDEYRASANLNLPLSDTLALRLSATGSHQDGWIENVFDGSYRNESDDWGARAKLRWNPSDTLDIEWAGDYSDRDCICTQNTLRSAEPGTPILAAILPVVPGKENTRHNDDGDMDLEVESSGHRLNVNWQVGEFTLSSITAYREWDEVFDEDVDSSPVVPIPGSVLYSFEQAGTLAQHQFSQEFRLLSPSDKFLTYVAGLYYFDQSVARGFARTFGLAATVEPQTTHTSDDVDSKNLAAFGEATFNFNPRWRGLLGARFTRDEITAQGFSLALPESAPVPSHAALTPGASSAVEESDFSIKSGVEWDIAQEVMAYLTYAQGYKGPAFNAGATNTEPQPPVDPETSDAYELGLKSRLFGNRLTLNIALFRTEFKDFQAEAFVPAEGELTPGQDPRGLTGEFRLSNAGEVVTQGLEIDFNALLRESWSLFGSLSLIDAEIESFIGGPCSFGQTFRGECPDGLQDLSGGDLPFTPKWKLNIMTAYTIPLTSLPFDVVLRGTFTAQDEVQFAISQDEQTIQDGYELLDLEVGLTGVDERWSVAAYVRNVFDTFYVSGIGATSDVFVPNGYLQSIPKTAERTAGLEFRYRWF